MKSKYFLALLIMLGLVTFAGFQVRAESGSGSDGDSSDDSSETEDSNDDSDENESDDSGMDSASDLDDSDEDINDDSGMDDDEDLFDDNGGDRPRPMNAGPGSFNSGPGSMNSGKPVMAPRPGTVPPPLVQKIISENRPSILENMEARKKFEEENGVPAKPGFFNERAQERMSEEARLRLEERFKNEAPMQARTRVHENFGRMIGNFDNIIPRIESRLVKMEEMGIDTYTVYCWIRDFRRKHHLSSYTESKGIKLVATKIDKEANRQLKARDKRIKELEEEVEILKKSLRIFMRPL